MSGEKIISAEVIIRLRTCDLTTEEALQANQDGDFSGLILGLIESRGIFDLLKEAPEIMSIKKIVKETK